MKSKIHLVLLAVVVLITASQSAFCQLSPNGLDVSGEARLYKAGKETQLHLTVHLLNTTNHEITVLTKNLHWMQFGTFDETKWVCRFGYNSMLSHSGHRVIPSLCDLAPVVLRPNEEALIHHVLEPDLGFMGLKEVTKDTKITIKYRISREWGDRFACWNGEADSEPITPTVAKSPFKKPL